TREQIIARIMALPEGSRFLVLAPVIRGQKGEYKDLFEDMLKRGFVRARVDGRVIRLTDDVKLDRRIKHNIEIVIDRLKNEPKVGSRLAEAVEQALVLGEGTLVVAVEKGAEAEMEDGKEVLRPQSSNLHSPSSFEDILLSARYACTYCDRSYEPPSPQLF